MQVLYDVPIVKKWVHYFVKRCTCLFAAFTRYLASCAEAAQIRFLWNGLTSSKMTKTLFSNNKSTSRLVNVVFTWHFLRRFSSHIAFIQTLLLKMQILPRIRCCWCYSFVGKWLCHGFDSIIANVHWKSISEHTSGNSNSKMMSTDGSDQFTFYYFNICLHKALEKCAPTSVCSSKVPSFLWISSVWQKPKSAVPLVF